MYLFSDGSLVDMTTTNHRARSIHIVVYIWLVTECVYTENTYIWFNKDCFGHWELGTRKLLFGGHSGKSLHCFVWPNAQCPIANSQCPRQPLLNQLYVFSVYTHSVTMVFQAIWLVRYLRRYIHCTAAVTGKLKQNNSADVKAVFCQSSRLGTYENKKKTLKRWSFWRKKNVSVYNSVFWFIVALL